MNKLLRQPNLFESSRENLAVTRSGVEFNPNSETWIYQDGVIDVNLDFQVLDGLSGGLIQSAKMVLKWYAENRSPGHLINLFNRLLHFGRSISVGERCLDVILAEDLINYRASLVKSTEWYLGALAGFLKRWHGFGYPGIDDSAILYLKQIRVGGNSKGVAVATMDPQDGPLTYIELESIQAALNAAYAKGDIDKKNYVLAWLFILLAQRNVQYALLKVCDVQKAVDAHGGVRYVLRMPSAKRADGAGRVRLVDRPLIEQFGEVLVEYADEVREKYKGLFTDVEQAPLFPSTTGRRGSKGYELHATATNIGNWLVATLDRLCVRSERTGERIKINARRFRSTLGTRAAEEGHSPLVIAALLDHTDLQNVGVYTASSPAIIERIDRAVAVQMAPLAQAFAGVIKKEPESDADPERRIIDLRIDRSGQAMGECGAHGFCKFLAPIACYTCTSFVAWLDGPHEAVLSHLIEQRDRLLKSSGKRIASINDRTILAVAEVVRRCSEIQSQSSGDING